MHKTYLRVAFLGFVYVSLINVEITKIVTSFLRYSYYSLTWDKLLYTDYSYYYWNKWYDLTIFEPQEI